MMQDWLDRLGYSAEPAALHMRSEAIPEAHPYALEIKALLKPDGAVQARAVFDVEGVPTVVFVGDNHGPFSSLALDEARKRIWNQNLATVVINVTGEQALALPVRKLKDEAGRSLLLEEARPDGPFSALDIVSANLSRRAPSWFDADSRVDKRLVGNLTTAVAKLSDVGFAGNSDKSTCRSLAELLMGQVLFLSYLEHRKIVGPTYRQRRNVSALHELVKEENRDGLRLLIDQLGEDFNGDFLGGDRHDPWAILSAEGFGLLVDFLRQTDMETGQGNFWNYDFSYIPVELLSGLYESFLSDEQRAKDGAVYTPRNLAVLAVDQAFVASPDPLAETVFDGACGSGILLTTAYRRLIALSEARAGIKLGFAERGALLKRHIFGGDINPMACRVTAFSLYLSLLEGLDPADIMEAQEREGVKLPSLKETNLACGSVHGDFFRDTHAFRGKQFTLIVSNPPWAEPDRKARTSADDWAEQANEPHVRRQIAGAYALRALDFLAEGGRACLILPIGQLLGTTSAAFVSRLLRVYQPTRLINFGDLQGLLFPTAENTCHVFVGRRRPKESFNRIPSAEAFDYCVPKADMSLAFGRLTMQSADRHQLQTQSVADDPQLLVTMMWGDANDLAILTRLTVRGTFAAFWKAPPQSRRWVCRKGIHLNDESRDAVSADSLRGKPFVNVNALYAGTPVLHPDRLAPWPENQKTVVGLNDAVLAVFDGPRVLFPDGFSKEEPNVRAVYYDKVAAFTHSVGVISGKIDDETILKFVAIYLRSSLARYFLMMLCWKRLCERNGVHLSDVVTFPFFDPIEAPDKQAAASALSTVASRMDELAELPELLQRRRYEELREELDRAVFDYFGLTDEERVLICETVNILLPSIRPRTLKSLDTPAQHPVKREAFDIYAHALAESLTEWRTRTRGRGRFHVGVVASDPSRDGPVGIVRVTYLDDAAEMPTAEVTVNDDLVLHTLAELREVGLRAIPSGDSLTLVPDTHLWCGGDFYLVRPLARRNWMVRQALRDAEHIVRMVQSRATSPSQSRVPS